MQKGERCKKHRYIRFPEAGVEDGVGTQMEELKPEEGTCVYY